MLGAAQPPTPRASRRQAWGKTKGGEAVELYTLTNAKGHKVVDHDATAASSCRSRCPTRAARSATSCSASTRSTATSATHPFFGAVVGRYGNRIGGAQFTLDGKTYTLAEQRRRQHAARRARRASTSRLEGRAGRAHASGADASSLTHVSPDGEEGFPGTLTATVTYTLTDDNELQHRLPRDDRQGDGGQPDEPLLLQPRRRGQRRRSSTTSCRSSRDKYTPVAKGLIPTGELAPRGGHAVRLPQADRDRRAHRRRPTSRSRSAAATTTTWSSTATARHAAPRGARHRADERPHAGGAHHRAGRAVLHRQLPRRHDHAARAASAYAKRAAFCLETQHFPDSPNQPTFPSTVLRPGQMYDTTTVYQVWSVGSAVGR